MAITIQQYPIGGQTITMAHNPIEYVVSSTNTAQSNFKYIADVWWNGATEPIRYIQGADPSNGRCRFDFSSVMRNTVTFDPPSGNTTNFQDCSNSYQTLTVKFGEQYGASSAITNYTNLSSGTIKIWNASLPIDRWWNGNDPVSAYIIGTTSKKFLTDTPTRTQSKATKLCFDDLYYLYFLQNNESHKTAYKAEFIIYYNNQPPDKYVTNCSISGDVPVLKVGVGPKNLQGVTAKMNNNVTGYYVRILNDVTSELYLNGTPISENFYFNIDCECTWETPYRLCFLNKLGGYDFFTFNWNSKKSSSYEKSYYKSKSWKWSSSNLISYSSDNRGKIQYSTIATDKLQLTSGWITEEQSTWLEELISSPDVYIIDNTTGNLTAITITDTQYDYKTLEYDQLFNITINVEFAHNRYRQSL